MSLPAVVLYIVMTVTSNSGDVSNSVVAQAFENGAQCQKAMTAIATGGVVTLADGSKIQNSKAIADTRYEAFDADVRMYCVDRGVVSQ